MIEQFHCPSGHQWSAESGGGDSAVTISCPVCGAAAAMAAAAAPVEPVLPHVPGYALLRALGKGGMGVVYHARHLALGREVALKVILAAEHAQPHELVRFLAEAEIVARLQHPNIVPIFDLGEVQGRPYFTMEFVTGGTLKQRLERGPLSDREAATLLLKLARAAEYAHGQGIVHRDLKPDNVLLAENGEPKITDFGVAKRLGGGGMTATGALVGTPAYMAPEQAAGKKEVGPAADVYALGAILYQCLAGRPPFGGDSIYDTLHKVLTEDPVSPAWFRPGVSRDLETICLKCLRKDPEQRYPSAKELAEDLELYLAHRPIRARRTPARERVLKWRRRHPTVAVLLLLLVLLLVGAAVAGWWYWDRYVAVHIDYYATWVKRWGAFEGIGRLTADDVNHRLVSYKFYTRAGRVERMDVVDGKGELTNQAFTTRYMEAQDPETPSLKPECYYTLERDAEGRVADEIGWDRRGRVVLHFHYTSPTTGTFTDGHGYPTARSGAGAAFVEFTRDGRGRDTEIRYHDKDMQPRPDPTGAYGLRMEYDGEDRLTRMTYLDAQGRPFRTNKGYATMEGEPDHFGGYTLVRYYDENGRRTWHKDGYAEIHQSFDKYGRLVESTTLDEDGKPVLDRRGRIRTRTSYSGSELSRIEWMDGDDQALRAWGEAVQFRWEVLRSDKTGKTVRATFLNADGQPTRANRWAASSVEMDDADGRPLDRAYFGPHGEPTFYRDGVAHEIMKYDDSGNLTEWEGYDANGALTRNTQWYARKVSTYDDRGRLIGEAYFGPDREPTLCKDGYASTKITLDADGKTTAVEYFDADGKATRCRDRYSRVTYDYDANGYVKEEDYYGPDGERTWHKDGYAILLKTNDARGNVLTRTALAPDGKRAVDWRSACEIRGEYDAWGNKTKVSYYGTDNAPRLSPEYAAVVERTFDRFGRITGELYFGVNGEKISCKDGYWQKQIAYDDVNRTERWTFLGVDGGPPAKPDKIAEIRRQRDSHGQIVEEQYRDADGKPALKDGRYARLVQDYDDRGLLVGESYWMNQTERAVGADGYAGAEERYDARGRLASMRFLGRDGKPGRNNQGAGGLESEYDDRGLLIAVSNVDKDGGPLALGGRVFKTRMAHNARGDMARQSYHGLQDQLVSGPSNYARADVDYDQRDNIASQTYFDPDRNKCSQKEGNARVVWRYNDCDEEVDHAYYGLDNQLKVMPTYGYARQIQTYDPQGALLTDEYHGADDAAMNGPDGYARRVLAYDDAGRQTGTTYFDKAERQLRMAVVVTGVFPGGVGEELGLKPGDVLIRYDGKAVENAAQFISARSAEKLGDSKRELLVRRGDQELEFSVPPGKMNTGLTDRVIASSSPGANPPPSDK